jgi:hypothetical protein
MALIFNKLLRFFFIHFLLFGQKVFQDFGYKKGELVIYIYIYTHIYISKSSLLKIFIKEHLIYIFITSMFSIMDLLFYKKRFGLFYYFSFLKVCL